MRRIPGRSLPSDSGTRWGLKWWFEKLWLPIFVGVVLGIFTLFSQKLTEPKTGELHLNSNLDGAKVYLNGDSTGFTSASHSIILKSLQPGQYILSVEKDGYKPYFESNVKIEAGQIASRYAQLDSLASKALPDSVSRPGKNLREKTKKFRVTFIVSTKFKNAKIFIDDIEQGNAPIEIPIFEGRHQLRVIHGDFIYSEVIHIPMPGENIIVIADSDFVKIEKK